MPSCYAKNSWNLEEGVGNSLRTAFGEPLVDLPLVTFMALWMLRAEVSVSVFPDLLVMWSEMSRGLVSRSSPLDGPPSSILLETAAPTACLHVRST